MKRKNYTNLMLLLCLWILGVGNVKGQLLTEQFEYGAVSDSLSFISGTTWNGHSLGGPSLTNPVQYVAGSSLSLGAYPTLGGKATFTTSGQDINSTFSPAVTSGTLYFSFLVNITSAQATGDYFIHTGPSPIGTTFNNRVFARLNGGNLQFGIQKTNMAPTTYGTNNYSTGTTYLIVVKYQFNAGGPSDDVSSLYVFTTTAPLTEPGVAEATNSVGTDPTSFQTIAIRQGTAANAPAGEIDYIRVGTTWADVTSVPSPTPTLTVNPASLSGFTTTTGTASAEQSYVLSGTNLTGFPGDITVTAPTDYEVSLTSGFGFASSVNVAYTGATLSNTTIFVRIAASAGVGTPSGNITNAGGGATTQNVAVSGTVISPTPTLSVNPTTLSGFTTTTGTASAEQSYVLSGTNLTGFPGDITVTAPTDYEVSLTSGSGFASSVNVAYTGATLSNTTIFVRIAASAGVGTPSGNITNAGGGATTQNVAVSGTVNAAPTLVPIANIRNALDANLAQTAPYANGTDVIIRGQIYGVNRFLDVTPANGTRQDFEFTVIDNSTGRNGIVIRQSGSMDVAPFDLQEGDDITVTGKVSQFNGLTQIGTITSVVRNSTGNARKTPIVSTVIGEDEESQLIRLNNVTILDKTQWNFTIGVTGTTPNRAKNVNIQVGTNTYQLRITEQSPLWGTTYASVFGVTEPTTGISIIGLGGQFDNSPPFDAGYQIFVTRLADIIAPVPVVPELSTNAPVSGLDFGTVARNEVSTSQTYKLIGKDLPTSGAATNVVINAPNNFQVSKNNTDFSSTVSFTNAEVNNAGTTGLDVYVRFAPTSEVNGEKGGDVTHSVPGIVPTLVANVAVRGVQAQALSIADEYAAKVQVYPNPAGRKIQIKSSQIYEVEVQDVSGRKILNFRSNDGADVEGLPNGMYFLQFRNGNIQFVKRLVIQK